MILVDCPGGREDEVWAAEKKGRRLGQLLGLQVKCGGVLSGKDLDRNREGGGRGRLSVKVKRPS